MFRLGDLVERVNAAAAKAPAVLMLEFNRDWNQHMAEIDDKISDASARRDALVAERNAKIVASVAGDPAAGRKADALETQIAAVDRELRDLGIARHHAASRIAVEQAAKVDAAEEKRINGAKKDARALLVLAQKIDAALANFRDALAEGAKGVEGLRVAAGPELHQQVVEFWAYAPAAISAALSEVNPITFHKPILFSADRLSFAGNIGRLFEPDYVAELTRHHKRAV